MKRLICLLVTCLLYGVAGTSASDEANIDQAIRSLNSHVRVYTDKKLVLTAVSQQTKVPEKTLQSQMNATHLSYGELLIVNSLVEGSGKNLNAVLAMKKGKGWASLSIELRIDPNSIVNRLRNAEKTVRAAHENALRSEEGIGNVASSSGRQSANPIRVLGCAERS